MLRLFVAFYACMCVSVLSAQTDSQVDRSDPTAVSLAQKSIAALTSGTPINDITLTGNVVQIYGSDNETGTGRFSAKGQSDSRVDITLSDRTRTDVRNLGGSSCGAWSENGSPAKSYAGHNCFADAVWFFPAFSSLAQTMNPKFVFKYIGQELHGSANTQHIQIYEFDPQNSVPSLRQLSTMDFFIDPTSALPLAISFETHADDNMNLNIRLTVNFANYKTIDGIQIPLHIQQMLNGTVTLDITVTSVRLDTGLVNSLFTLL